MLHCQHLCVQRGEISAFFIKAPKDVKKKDLHLRKPLKIFEPGFQVREGKPSKSCKEDDEKFCLCGKIGKGEGVSWR
jgi:hypothetical protein